MRINTLTASRAHARLHLIPDPLIQNTHSCKNGIARLEVLEELLGRRLVDERSARVFQTICILVKVVRVTRGLNVRHDLTLHLALNKRLEVKSLEPLVLFDVLRPILQIAYPLRPVAAQKLSLEVLRRRVEVSRELDPASEDLLVNAERILVEEGRVARQHLKHEYSQCPPVDTLAVALRRDDFRCEILWRPAQRPRPIRYYFRKPKIGDSRLVVPECFEGGCTFFL